MGRFAEAAKKATTLSILMEGREKTSVADIVYKHPDGITIMAADIISGVNDKGEPYSYPVIVYKEDETKYLNGGTVLNRVVEEWLSLVDGDIEAMNEGLRQDGGVRVKLESGRTAAGRNITKVIVL